MKALPMIFLLTLLGPCQAQLSNTKKGWWNVNVAYPRFKSDTSAARAANKLSSAREKKVFNKFLAEARSEMPELKQMRSSAMYEFLVQPITTTDNAKVCSGYVMTYAFTAGAHGNTTFEAINVGQDGNPINLQDLFQDGVNGQQQCSYAVVEQLLSTGRGSSVQTGDWRELTSEQAKNFVITPKGLLFLFGSYELGPYAEGTFKVEVPFSKIRGLRPNWKSST